MKTSKIKQQISDQTKPMTLTGKALEKVKFRQRILNDPEFAKQVNDARKARRQNNLIEGFKKDSRKN